MRTASDDLDVDARFLLANERTLLAWVRTALTLLAGGVAIDQFAAGDGAKDVAATVLLLLALASAVTGAARYRFADRALRRGQLPAAGLAPYAIAASVAVVAVGAIAVVLV